MKMKIEQGFVMNEDKNEIITNYLVFSWLCRILFTCVSAAAVFKNKCSFIQHTSVTLPTTPKSCYGTFESSSASWPLVGATARCR